MYPLDPTKSRRGSPAWNTAERPLASSVRSFPGFRTSGRPCSWSPRRTDISGLPPEFLRPGRFDDTFFVGLPSKSQRAEILGIHLRRRERVAEPFDLQAIADVTAGFSGAELEQAVIAGLFTAFGEGQRELTTQDILHAAADIQPLAKSRAREIAALIEWASQNAKQAG